MRSDEIRQAVRAQLFRPFTIHLADGREFAVNHPEFILAPERARTIVLADVEGNLELIDPTLVTSLSFADSASETPGT